MKKLMCAAIVAGLSGWAVAEMTVTNGYSWTYSVENGKAVITAVNPAPSGTCVIPSALDGVPVETLGYMLPGTGMLTYASPFYWLGMFPPSPNLHVIISEGIQEIGGFCFSDSQVTYYRLPSSLRNIGPWAFAGNANLRYLEIPAGIERMPLNAFSGVGSPFELVLPERFRRFIVDQDSGAIPSLKVHFKGGPLEDLSALNWIQSFTVEQKYFNAWAAALNVASLGNAANPAQMPMDFWPRFAGICGRTAENAQVTIVSSGFRKNNPMIYDVVYRVASDKPKVRVRALGLVEQMNPDGSYAPGAFYRPQNWGEGTAASIGDSIAANADHKLSWYISEEERMNMGGAGMNMRLRVEVLACAGELLPVTETTIPGNLGLRRDIMSETESRVDAMEYMAGVPEMKVTFDRFTREQVSRAAKFLYACGDETVLQWIDPNMLSDDATLMMAETYVLSSMGYVTGDMPLNLKLAWNDVNYWYQKGSENVRNVISSTAQTSYMVDGMAVRDRIFAAFGIGVNTGMMNPPPSLLVQPKVKYVGVEIAQ